MIPFLMLMAAAAPPNIIFLYSDDHAAHAVSAYRQYLPYSFPLPATPNIDRIAREGMLFRNAFATNSICGPARAAVLTGEYGHLTGVMTNNDSLHQTVLTFPKLLRGYQTAIFGKWHLKDRPAHFNHYEVLSGQGSYYNPVLLSERDSVRHIGYSQQIITDRALNWAKEQKEPFFLMIAFNAPHRPWQPGPNQLSLYRDHPLAESPTLTPEDPRAEMSISKDLVEPDLKLIDPENMTPEQLAEWKRWYDAENATYDGSLGWKYQRFIKDYMRAVQGIDEQVGRVLANLPPNTIVIYSSDQGFFLGDRGWFDKRWMYDESIRTPLLVRWPGVVKPGSVDEHLVMNLDFAATFLDIAGQPNPTQGMSILPLLRGKHPNWRDAIYYQYFGYPDWHMVRRQYGVRDQRYKLISFYETNEWELYDLKKDPFEQHNIYATDQKLAAKMKRKLAALRMQYRAPEHDPVPYTPFELPPAYKRK
jgi:arylsulfatase A-like enzyme